MTDNLYVYNSLEQGMIVFEVNEIQRDGGIVATEFTTVFVQKHRFPGLNVGEIRRNLAMSLLRPITSEEYQIFKAATALKIPLTL